MPEVVTDAWSPTTQEAEAGGLPTVWGLLCLHKQTPGQSGPHNKTLF